MAKSKSETQTLSVRVDADTADRLDRLAEATDRPRSWHIEQALDAYLDVQAWQIREIEKGVAELMAGKGVPHSKIKEWADGLRHKKARKPAK
jgi:predicted transcriptional regulator